MSTPGFGDQRPLLLDCKVHSQGTKLVVENNVNGGELVLPLESHSLIARLDGRQTVKEIVSDLYANGDRLGFRSIFSTLQTLHDHGLLERFQPPGEGGLHEEAGFFDSEKLWPFRSLSVKPIFRKVSLKWSSPVVFYLFALMISSVAVFSPSGLIRAATMGNFLRIGGGYAWALPVFIASVSVMLTLKTLLKSMMVLLATGWLYRLELKVKWFGVYLSVSDHGIFHSRKKSVIVIYQLTSAFMYFFAAAIIGMLFPQNLFQDTLRAIALFLTLVDTHPYQRSDITRLFGALMGERELRHMIPYLKSRSLLSVFVRPGKIAHEKAYLAFSTIALCWFSFAMVLALKMLSQNIAGISQGWLRAPFFDFMSRSVLIFTLVVFSLYSVSDILTTIAKNFLQPAMNPLLRVWQKLRSRPVPARARPEALEILRQVLVFGDVSEEARAFLIEHSVVKSFASRSNLIIQGTQGREVFVLLKGAVDVVRREATGLRIRVATLRAPAVFGEIGVVRDVLRTADVVSSGEVEVLVIAKDVFDQMLKQTGLEADRKLLINKFSLSHYISSSPLFSQLPAETAHLFSQRGRIESVAKGQTILRQGDVSKSFYLLIEGEVEVQKDGATVAELKQGDFFGEIALIADLPRTATVVAKSESLVLRLDQTEFWDILAGNVQVAMSLESVAENRLEEARCSA